MQDRHDPAGGGAASPDRRDRCGGHRSRTRSDQRSRPGDARRLDLRPWPDGFQCHPECAAEIRAGGSSMTPAIPIPLVREIEVTIDGRSVRVTEGSTILQACASIGIHTPTLCYLETLTPVNVCRVCVVEVEGSRVLVPACSRQVEQGMVIQTDSERVQLSRRLVFELLGSSVDLSLATPEFREDMTRYGATPERLDAGNRASVSQPVKIDNNLY